ncbi:MAG: metallophosphoesterase [Candidatus Diapherotrites archaeon]|nr:metallophosphoesterase [Candidatus Diapherotrites archaeon]
MSSRKVLWNEPALLLDDKALVIGDLHIGLESSLSRKGVRLGSNTRRMLAHARRLVRETGAEDLIILGDLKERIGAVSAQEAREVPAFLHSIAKEVNVVIVLGNHDAGLGPLLSGFETHPPSGFLYGKHLLIHGNAKPNRSFLEQCDDVIASHWHPVINFRAGQEKVWVQAVVAKKKLLIMPSFNNLLGGVDVSRIDNKWVDLSRARVWLMDGVEVGVKHA